MAMAKLPSTKCPVSTNPSTTVAANTSYLITWTTDVDDQATIAIYYDEDSSGFNGTLIADNLQESIDSSYTWDTSVAAERDYYLYAIIDDGINTPVYQYASGKVIIRHPTIELTAFDTGYPNKCQLHHRMDCQARKVV